MTTASESHRPATVVNHPHLIAAIDAGQTEKSRGFAFLNREGGEDFMSFATLREEAMNRAAHFRALGLKHGDRVALVLPDGQDFVPTFLGAVWAGLVPVPLYPPLSLGKLDAYLETLVNICRKATPAYLVTNAKLSQVLWSGAARIPSLQGVLAAEELRQPAPSEASREPAKVSGDDLCFLQFTSGSTSLPKGVEVTHDALRANAWAIMRDGLNTDSSVDMGVSWLPLYHDMGLIGFVLSPLFHNVQVTFIPTLSFVRGANIWLSTIHKKRGTISFAPNFAYSLAAKRAKPEQLENWDLSCMRAFGCGAEPINPTTMKNFVETFIPAGLKASALVPCYGMAEATLAISFIGLDEELSTDKIDATTYRDEKRAVPAQGNAATVEFVSCGRTFPGHDVGAFADDGQRLPDRQVGELWVKGPSIARGYYQDPQASEATFGQGWLRTGDLGYLVDGQVFITGRKKDLIIINGRNYDPQRIEWLVDEMPEVRRGNTVAFSVPGQASEELVVVVESRSENPAALKEAITQRVNEELSLNCSAVVVAPPGSLPKTSSGKLQRSRTRQQYLDGTVGKEGVRTLGASADRAVLAKHVALAWVGKSRHRVRRIAKHTIEIRNLRDAVYKVKLANHWARALVGRLLP
ncbi:MAG: fatty acyl-AMP ligase [Myxococcaceae bacterium]|nr:fatty acyl-AMP ligase [Myxococcaceae bacterium]